MAVHLEFYRQLIAEFKQKNVTLVAVSKTKPVSDILELYHLGQRDFGENYVQELVEKQAQLPKDIRWHFIGHLQSNKVKLIVPFISLIHSVDSEKLLKEINKQAAKNDRIIDCLLQVYIASEETKFGLNEEELNAMMNATDYTNAAPAKSFKNVCIKGLMGMASFTDDKEIIRKEFKILKTLFDKYSALSVAPSSLTTHHSPFTIVSMGMSSDYKMAIEEGSNMVRIGSLLFGDRHYPR